MKITQRVELAIEDAVTLARTIIPKDTGQMRYDSFKLERIDETTWRIYIDQDIAPYAKYVNEKLPSHHTPKQLANEGFFDRVFDLISNQLASALNGQIVVEQTSEQEN